MNEKEYLKQYSMVINLKEIAKHAFRAGVYSANEDNEKVSTLLKEIIELKLRVKDLEKCLDMSNFHVL